MLLVRNNYPHISSSVAVNVLIVNDSGVLENYNKNSLLASIFQELLESFFI